MNSGRPRLRRWIRSTGPGRPASSRASCSAVSSRLSGPRTRRRTEGRRRTRSSHAGGVPGVAGSSVRHVPTTGARAGGPGGARRGRASRVRPVQVLHNQGQRPQGPSADSTRRSPRTGAGGTRRRRDQQCRSTAASSSGSSRQRDGGRRTARQGQGLGRATGRRRRRGRDRARPRPAAGAPPSTGAGTTPEATRTSAALRPWSRAGSCRCRPHR